MLFLGFYQSAAAQTKTDELNCMLKGKLMDLDDATPVSFANVVLYKMGDSIVATWSVSDENGAFLLSKISKGTYRLVVNFLGYEKMILNNVVLDKSNITINLGQIKLTKVATLLGSVEIVGTKKNYESKIDRKVINVSKDINATGGTAIDLIKNVPGLTIDADGVVSLRGNAGVSILVDGRPTSIDATKLEQIASSQIESIEIITNPTVRYNPEGKSGIINLKMKQTRALGLNGNAMLTAGTGDKYNGSLNLNYNMGKVNFFANYTGMSKKGPGSRYLLRESFLSDTAHFVQQDVKTRMDVKSNKFDLGATFNFNPQNTLTLSYSINPVTDIDADGTLSQYFNKSMILKKNVFTDNSENKNENSKDYLLGYLRTFDKKGEELTIDYTYAKSNSDQIQSLVFHRVDGVSKAQILTNASNYNSNFQLNWIYPFSKDSKIESGVQSIIRGSENNFYFNNYFQNAWQEDVLQRNLFVYDEQIHSVYGMWSVKHNQITVLSGIRLEQTFITGKQGVNVTKIDQKYFNFYPSFNFLYAINQNKSLQFSFSRRINRPNAHMINPFVDRSNLEVYRGGNADLKPEYINSFEAGYNSSWNNSSAGITVFYKNITNLISQVTILDSTGISHLIPENMASGQNYGFEVTFEHPITSWWKVNGNASFFKNFIKGVDAESTNSNYSYNARLNTTFLPFKKLSIQMIGNYAGPAIGISSKMKSQYYMDIAVKKDFSGEKLSMTIRASDIFNTRKNEYTSWGSNFTAANWRKQETRIIYLSIAYKFGSNGQVKNSKPSNNDENKQQNNEIF